MAGHIVLELRVIEGQKVRRGEIVAVLSKYPTAAALMQRYEAELAKAGLRREAMVSGYRVAEIAMQELMVRAAVEKNSLKALEMRRSGQPADQKLLELSISERKLDWERTKLVLWKERLATDLAQIDSEIKLLAAKLDGARVQREQALVRSPLDGIVVEVRARQGERVSVNAIAKVVDMANMRVLADVSEVNIDRIKLGGGAEVTFRGDRRVFKGTVARIPAVVKRLQRPSYEPGNFGDSRVVTVEIKFDDTAEIPRILGHEATVVFL